MERMALRALLSICTCAGSAAVGCASPASPAPPSEYDTMVAASTQPSSLPPVAFKMVPDSRTNTLYYVITNRGSSTPVDVTFSYQATAGAPAVAATPSNGDCGLTGAQVACTLKALAPGATQTIEVQLSPQSGQKIATNAHLQVASATGGQGTATLQPVLPAVSGSASTTATGGGHFAQGLALSPAADLGVPIPPIAFTWGASADQVSLTATNTGDQAITMSLTLTAFDKGNRVDHIQAVVRQATPSRGEARWNPPAPSSAGVVWNVTMVHCDSATLRLQLVPGAGGSVTFGGPFAATTPPPGGPNTSNPDPMRGSVAQPGYISPASSPPECTGQVALTGPSASGTVSRTAPSTTASPAAVPSPSGAVSAPRTPGRSPTGSRELTPSGRPSASPSPSASR
jgi:hypothetical protein